MTASPLILEHRSSIALARKSSYLSWEAVRPLTSAKKNGSTFYLSTTGFPISRHNSIDVIGVAKGNRINSRKTLESTPYPVSDIAENEFRELASALNYPVHAVLLDLSDLGYREGEKVTSISLGSDKSKADLVGAYAIPQK